MFNFKNFLNDYSFLERLEITGIVLGIITSIVGTFYGLYIWVNKRIEVQQKKIEREKKLFESIHKIDVISSNLEIMRGNNKDEEESLRLKNIEKILENVEIRQMFNEKATTAVLTSLDIGYWESDSRGNCVKVSVGLCKIMDRLEEEILGYNWENCISKEDKERVDLSWKKSVEENKNFNEIYSFVKRDGTLQKVKGIAYQVRDSSDNLKGFFGMVIIIK